MLGVATHRAASSSEPYSETASRRSRFWYSGERQPLSTTNSTPSSAASVAAWRRAPRRAGSRLATPGIASSKTVVPSGTAPPASPSAPRCSMRARGEVSRDGRRGGCGRRGRGRRQLVAEGCGDRHDDDRAGRRHGTLGIRPTGRCSCWFAVGHAASQGSVVLPARMRFSIRRRYAPARSIGACVCCSLRTSPIMAEAIRDGLRLEAIAADIAGNGDTVRIF